MIEESRISFDERTISIQGEISEDFGVRPIAKDSYQNKLHRIGASFRGEILNPHNLKERLSTPCQSVTGLANIVLNRENAAIHSTEHVLFDPETVSNYYIKTGKDSCTAYINGEKIDVSGGFSKIPIEMIVPGENHIRSPISSKVITRISPTDSPEAIVKTSQFDWELYQERSVGFESLGIIETDPVQMDAIELNNPLAHFVKSCALNSSFGKYEGIPHPVYNINQGSYRGNFWAWSAAPAVTVLFDIGEHDLARKAARGFAELIERNPGGVGGIGVNARTDPDQGHKSGVRRFVPPNDSAYVALWGWLSAYRHTNDSIYLEYSKEVSEMISNVYDQFGFLPEYYDMMDDEWMDRTYVDACFTVTFLKELYKETNDNHIRELALSIMDDLIDRLQRSDGLFVMNNGDNNNRPENQIFVRGQGWAIDGLLAAAELGGESYLDTATKIADELTRYQNGGWGYFLNRWEQLDTTSTAVVLYCLKLLNQQVDERDYGKNIKEAMRACKEAMVTKQCTKEAYGGMFCRTIGSGLVGNNYSESATILGTSYYFLAKNDNE